MEPDGLPDGYSFVSDAYSAPAGPQGDEPSTADKTPPCGLGQGGPSSPTPRRRFRPPTPATRFAAAAATTASAAAPATTASTAARASDRLKGDDGDDKLKGGKRPRPPRRRRRRVDKLGGGPGRDVLRSKGGGRDIVKCGPGKDKVIADRRDKLGRGCEAAT